MRHGGDGQICFLERLIDAEGGHSKDGTVMPTGVSSSDWLKRIRDLIHVGRESNDQRTPAKFFLSVPGPPIGRSNDRLNAIVRKHRRPSW
jgi:hypothetical protein